MRVVIVGGGLATALATTQAGSAVMLHERSPELVDEGAGISLAPNATRILHHIGIGPDPEATWVTAPMTEYRHYRRGKVIIRMMSRDLRALYGSPHLRMHRRDLQVAMMRRLAEVAPGTLRLGFRVVGVVPRNGHAGVRFAEGRDEIADVVVAAEGWSCRGIPPIRCCPSSVRGRPTPWRTP